MEVDQAALMGMGIEHAAECGGAIEVRTPGCRVALDAGSVLRVTQRIGCERELLGCALPPHNAPWRIGRVTPFACEIVGTGLTVTVQGDSVLVFAPRQHLRLAIDGRYAPAYAQEVRGQRLLLDAQGGCGVFGFPARPTELEDAHGGTWRLHAHLARYDELWVSICPPRARDPRRRTQSIAHECPEMPDVSHLPEPDRYGAVLRFLYERARPSEAVIRECARNCQVLALHEGWAADAPAWAENPPGSDYTPPRPWETDHPVPADPRDFAVMRDLAQSLGMAVTPYLSPYYSNAPDLPAEMRRVVDEYAVDGLYFDGWSGVRDDWRPAYRLIREARGALGDRVLYLHSSGEPYGTCRVVPPFVFAYADFVLCGEAGRFDLDLDAFLRYTVGQWQISNSVGVWCTYGSTGNPGYQFAVPSDADIEAALRNHVRIWRMWGSWRDQPADLARFDRSYYARLADHLSDGDW